MSKDPGRSLLGERIGRYTIRRQLAAGGMGVVFEAVHEDIGHRSVVKVLSAELAQDPKQQDYVERFLGEARAVNLVQHPGLVRIFDFGQLPDGAVYIMMELLEGEPLWDRMERRRTEGAGRQALGPAEALRVVRQLASALGAAHERGIVHRDLKPENVILVPDPEAPGGERTKLLDFGIARFLDSPQRMTTAGMVLGTALYMSPEQCQGAEQLDDKADVYSLGVMLYEMLGGRPPFDGETALVLRAHLFERPRPLAELCPGLPAEVYALADELLAKDPAARPAMAQVEARVAEIERSGALPDAGPASPPPAGRTRSATRRTQLVSARREHGGVFLSWPLLMLGLVGVVLLSIVGALWATGRPAPAPPGPPAPSATIPSPRVAPAPPAPVPPTGPAAPAGEGGAPAERAAPPGAAPAEEPAVDRARKRPKTRRQRAR